jgi:riboflavin kinase
VEPHLLHTFAEDFYGEILSISIVGYLRPELDYTTLEALKEAIATDITLAKNNLEGMEKPASITDA